MPVKLSVAIVGGGIGGLTAAVALAKFPDIDIHIYEAATAFSEVGAGVGVWPRIWKTLRKLGLAEDLKRVTHLEPKEETVDTFQFRKSDQPTGNNFYKLQTHGSFLTYHRPDFQQVLIDNLPSSVKITYCKRVQSYSQSIKDGNVTLEFVDGSTVTHDLVIGADGIKSAIRKVVLEEQAAKATAAGREEEAKELLNSIEPIWTGIVAYRNLIPTERLVKYKETHPETRVPKWNSIPTMYMGQHINVVVYPISSGKKINVAAFHAKDELFGTKFDGPWVTNVEKDDLIAAHGHWEPELRAILENTDKPSRWAIHMSKPLKSWISGNVVLLGDAAHAMSPQQASGGGQAIEDAYVLSLLLGHSLTTKATLGRALSIYDVVRRPVANKVAQRSLLNGKYFGLQLPGVDLDLEENQHRLPELGEAIKANWNWTWTTTLDQDAEEAVKMLERSASYENIQPSL